MCIRDRSSRHDQPLVPTLSAAPAVVGANGSPAVRNSETGRAMASSNDALDIRAVLESLAAARKVFHSEADFQFAFAWEAKCLWPTLEVRLENHPEPNVRLDLQFTAPAAGIGIAIEMKYMTRLWSGTDRGRELKIEANVWFG